ncbi:MAG TPA: adenylate/guanylate cyclase domain-containing protein [Micromonosporaceae bacterium]|nr:adenylate/guanylate cyclase domain-containing protein [Micromonosporaceae bacterium]
MICVVCGTVPVPGARFCHHCGVALPAAAAEPTTERRMVTVLFGDLSDFTAWAEDLDPERVGAVTDRVLAALARAVTMFGGHVDKLTGDGIMAVFGAPVAHEDDPERAVRAALAMQRAVRRVLDVEQGGGVPLGLRVGLNTGVVVAGVQAALEYTVIGDTVNTAARLADAAAIGAVYAGGRTATVTRHLAAWRHLTPLRLKGKRAPVATYELLGLRDAPGTRSGLGDEAPFVGREPEMGRFASRLAEAVDRGQPQIMVLTAEAGIGKTRFAAEASRHAAEHGARVLSVRCAAYGENRRLAPLADLVRVAAGLSADDSDVIGEDTATAAARLIRIANRIDRARQEAAPDRYLADQTLQVPLLLAVLGHGEHGQRGDLRSPLEPTAVATGVAQMLSGLATESPLLVVVDDIHDATGEAVDALGTVLAALTGPVLVVLLGRPELVRKTGNLTRLSEAEVHTLAPLRGADAARLLSAYLNGGKLPATEENQLLATSQGNPFYLAELVTLLVERGMLTGGPDGWQLAPGSLGGRLLSRDLAAVLAARIDALPPDTRAVLRDAAVVGDTVPAGALEALRGGGRTGVAAMERERAIDELLARRMLRRRSSGGYRFVTPLMREAAYAGVGRAVLAARHAELARWGAAQYQAAYRHEQAHQRQEEHQHDPSLSMSIEQADAFTARHAERAITVADWVGLRTDAEPRKVAELGVAALARMARRALAAAEPAEAARLDERAMALAGGALPAADRLVHARALLQLGRAAEARAVAEKVVANTVNRGDRVSGLLLLGEAHRAAGEAGQAAGAWQEALAAAELPEERVEATYRLGMADYLAGRLADAQARFEAACQIAAEAGDRKGQAWALLYLAWAAATRGDFQLADSALGQSARLFAKLRDPVGRAWIRGATAFARLFAGRFSDARRLAYAFLPFGERVGGTWAVATLRAVAGFAEAELGNLAEAEAQARLAFRGFDSSADDWGRGLALVVRAVAARGRGEPHKATRFLDRAERYARHAGHSFLVGMVCTVRGWCLLDMDNAPAAEADARCTLQLVDTQDLRDAARVGPRVLLAEALRAQGDLDGAIRLLADVADTSCQESLIFPRRQAVAAYASALLAAGEVAPALAAAGRAVALPAEDVRSDVYGHLVHAETLAAAGDAESARAAAGRAVELAYATERVSERAAADALLARLVATVPG